jgi:chromosome segregation ATPase
VTDPFGEALRSVEGLRDEVSAAFHARDTAREQLRAEHEAWQAASARAVVEANALRVELAAVAKDRDEARLQLHEARKAWKVTSAELTGDRDAALRGLEALQAAREADAKAIGRMEAELGVLRADSNRVMEADDRIKQAEADRERVTLEAQRLRDRLAATEQRSRELEALAQQAPDVAQAAARDLLQQANRRADKLQQQVRQLAGRCERLEHDLQVAEQHAKQFERAMRDHVART